MAAKAQRISSAKKKATRRPTGSIRFARTCYDHLAGELGVQLTEMLEQNGSLVAEGERLYRLTPSGEVFLRQWKIDVPALRALKRSFARRCLDWTERRDHLAGALGAAIYQKFVEFDWVRHDPASRAVHLTAEARWRLEPLLSSSMDRDSHDSEMPDVRPRKDLIKPGNCESISLFPTQAALGWATVRLNERLPSRKQRG